jgi:hypothetical protein
MEFYSATKKNVVLSSVGKWIELKKIILSEVSQAQKAKNHVLPHMWIIDLKNAAILLDTGYTKEKLHRGGIGQGKETKT